MKKMKNFLYRSMYPLMVILVIALVFSACKKNDYTYKRTPSAGLMAFNLITDKPVVGFTLSGNFLTNTPLYYTSYTGQYLPVYLGSRAVKSYDANTDATLATSTQVFTDSMYYSLFAVGNAGNYRNVLVNDKLDSLVAVPGYSFVRYINAIPDSSSSPLVTIASNGNNVVSATAPFPIISGFTKVPSGYITVGVNNNTTVSASRTITVDDGKVYTILLVGIPTATDSARTVKIKFIQNGNLNNQ